MKHRMATGIEESILSNELAQGAPSYLKLWFRLGLNSRRSLITQEAGVATGRLVSKLGSGKLQFCVLESHSQLLSIHLLMLCHGIIMK